VGDLRDLAQGGVALKLETEGSYIDAAGADRIAELNAVRADLGGRRNGGNARTRAPGRELCIGHRRHQRLSRAAGARRWCSFRRG
jgi:hypothetical protein